MKGLRKYLTPFAPDQSGAVSVLYELGGMLVICDAGGCTGNVCGFDEPRWFETRSAVFSAGLRDMDAILGRDDRLVAKLADAAEKLDVTFAAVIGTPVPAVIGTDYRALERMLAKKTELPVLTVNTDGMELYDRGEEKAYLVLFGRFAGENVDVEPGNIEKTQTAESCDGKRNGKNEDVSVDIEDRPRVGIIGMTPQDVSDLKAAEKIRKLYADQGLRAVCYGMGDGLDEVRNASLAAKNVVVSPAALKAAQYLQKKFGTPYEIAYPLVSELVPEVNYQGKKILIVQQQVIANAVRKEIEKRTGEKETITTATWFMRKEEILTDLNVDAVDDISLKEEDDFISLVEKEGYDVIFDHVKFSYETGKTVLKDVSFTAKQGQVTALVGPSGGGKSTIAKLAAKFYDVDGGKITLGGADIAKIDPVALMKDFSIVFQDVVLFNNTIMENIRVGRKGASDEDVIAAAKAAKCHDFIEKLPQGYQTVIGENGSTLSGGECQRLSIARALLKDAPVILLDEATASLDVDSETQIQEAISELVSGKTVLVIAHRMRTIEAADQIVVLDKGVVAEKGNHDTLMKKNGLYRKLVDLQTEAANWKLSV